VVQAKRIRTLAAVAGMAVSASAMAQTWNEATNGGGDAGDLPSTSQSCFGVGTLTSITGDNAVDDVDMFQFEITDRNVFRATTVSVTTFDTQLFLFDALGRGVTYNDDDPSGGGLQSTITGVFVPANGPHYLAISKYNIDPLNANNDLIWANTPFNVERIPDGPGAGDPVVRAWLGTSLVGGAYTINLQGAGYLNQGPTGACCRTDGSCIITSGASCTGAGGIYRGDGSVCATANCPQPATGACCLPATCSILTTAQCLAQGGTYRGDNTSCGTANCPITEYVESGDAGDLPGTAAVVSGSGALSKIRGNLAGTDADMFQINICSPGSFEATTVGGSTVDTQLFLFDANGVGITHDDDDPITGVLQSRLSSLYTSSLPAGNYYLAISAYNMDPVDASNALLWLSTPFNVERFPDGPGAANPVRAWLASGSAGAYAIALQGSCFVSTGPACYPNCDGSNVPPILNVSDFICFQTKYAAGDPYANCDGSTTPPVLNVSDFICFQTKYAAGCT